MICAALLVPFPSSAGDHATTTAVAVSPPLNLVLQPRISTERISMGFSSAGQSSAGLNYSIRYSIEGRGTGAVSCPALTRQYACYRPNPGSSGMSWTEYKVTVTADPRSFAWSGGRIWKTGSQGGTKCYNKNGIMSNPVEEDNMSYWSYWVGTCNMATWDGKTPATSYCAEQMIELSRSSSVKAGILASFMKYYAGCSGTAQASVLEL